MCAPIKDKLLSIEGNHDGSYYWDGGSIGVGTAYTKQLTEQEMFEEYYRANGLTADVHFDKNSNAFYVDDVSNRVRYIGLNSMNVPNDTSDVDTDGIAKYPKFPKASFLQAQYDFLCNEALTTGLTDDWCVVVFGHSGIYNAGDYAVMVDVLSAYKDKTNCVSEYAGIEAGGPAYTNLAEPDHNNTTDTTKWVNGYRISVSSSNPSAEYAGVPTTLSNTIDLSGFDQTEEITIRVKGVTLREGSDRTRIEGVLADGGGAFKTGAAFNENIIAGSTTYLTYGGYADGVHTFIRPAIPAGAHTITQFRFSMETPADENEANKVIVTLNELIVENEHGYDYVSVNHDFSDAKGEFIAYFHGHDHKDSVNARDSIKDIGTRCDGVQENAEELRAQRVSGTITEQSFDVFTVNRKTRKIYAAKIGAGEDREISY